MAGGRPPAMSLADLRLQQIESHRFLQPDIISRHPRGTLVWRRRIVMLLLSRKVGERIRIADDITLVVTAIQGDRVKIGIEAPMSVSILRGELESNRRTSPGFRKNNSLGEVCD